MENPEKDEIKRALFDINLLKTSREDDLYTIFYRKNWEITKRQLIPAITKIFTTWTLPGSWGKTLLYLISKIENSHLASHLCPLGLCTTHYKDIAKNDHKQNKTNSKQTNFPFQGAYCPKRHSNHFLLAQDTMNSM